MNEPTIKIAKIAVYLPDNSEKKVNKVISSHQILIIPTASQIEHTLFRFGFRSILECRTSIITLLNDIDLVIIVKTLSDNLLGDNVGG